MKPVYIVLAGLPGSGKTYLRNMILSQWLHPKKPVVLSSDDWIEAEARGWNTTYDAAFEKAIGAAGVRMQIIKKNALLESFSIIHDQTNLSARKRRASIAEVSSAKYLKVCLFTQVDESVRLQRLGERVGKTIPYSVQKEMAAAWQTPTHDEGFDLVGPAHLAEHLLSFYVRQSVPA